MAQKSSDIDKLDRLDRANTTLDQPSEGYVATSTDDEVRELNANTGDHPEEAEQIKGQIVETRREMGETIDAIQEKLSFSNISGQVSEHVSNAVDTAKDAVYDATVGKAVYFMKNVGDGLSSNSIVRTAKNNPFPFLLIGLGAGLLAYQNYSSGGRRRRGHGLYGGRHEFRGQTEFEGQGIRQDFDRQYGRSSGSVLTSAKESIGGVGETVSSAAGTAYNKVTGAVDTVYSSTGEALGTAYNKVGEFGGVARDQYDHYLQENPLALGAVALAVGAAVGMAIPSTKYEGELMGEARQQLMERAQSTATGLIDKTKQVVNETSKTVTEQARTFTE